MDRKTKLTIAEVIPNLQKIICPCLVSCPSLKGNNALVLYLQKLGYETNRNTLKWVISKLYMTGKPYFTIYGFVPGKPLNCVYSSILVTDVCKVYRSMRLGRQRFYDLIK